MAFASTRAEIFRNCPRPTLAQTSSVWLRGGAIYVRDPHARLVNEQLNGGEFANVTDQDWKLISPYLQENERLFGIRVEDLLTVYGVRRPFEQVYRKVKAVRLAVLASMIQDSED